MLMMIPLSSFGQNRNSYVRYYNLYKGGNNIVKPVIFLLNTCTSSSKKINDNTIIFNIKNRFFKYDGNIHFIKKLTSAEFKAISLTNVSLLENLEYQEYLTEALKVEKKTGFKPVPPIEHSILQIFVIDKNKDSIIMYETSWLSNQF